MEPEAALRGVQVVVIAGVVDDPEVGDDVGDDAPAAVAVNNVVDEARGYWRWRVVGTGTEVEKMIPLPSVWLVLWSISPVMMLLEMMLWKPG